MGALSNKQWEMCRYILKQDLSFVKKDDLAEYGEMAEECGNAKLAAAFFELAQKKSQ